MGIKKDKKGNPIIKTIGKAAAKRPKVVTPKVVIPVTTPKTLMPIAKNQSSGYDRWIKEHQKALRTAEGKAAVKKAGAWKTKKANATKKAKAGKGHHK